MAKTLYEIYICTSFCANSCTNLTETFDANGFQRLVSVKNEAKIAIKTLALAKIQEAKTL